nr:MAG TPA: hypothetical protein [Caudovirales sp. ctNII2]
MSDVNIIKKTRENNINFWVLLPNKKAAGVGTTPRDF